MDSCTGRRGRASGWGDAGWTEPSTEYQWGSTRRSGRSSRSVTASLSMDTCCLLPPQERYTTAGREGWFRPCAKFGFPCRWRPGKSSLPFRWSQSWTMYPSRSTGSCLWRLWWSWVWWLTWMWRASAALFMWTASCIWQMTSSLLTRYGSEQGKSLYLHVYLSSHQILFHLCISRNPIVPVIISLKRILRLVSATSSMIAPLVAVMEPWLICPRQQLLTSRTSSQAPAAWCSDKENQYVSKLLIDLKYSEYTQNIYAVLLKLLLVKYSVLKW